jgi:MFS family permease
MVGVCVTLAAGADRLWQFYLLFFTGGVFGAALFAPLIALVGGWFPAAGACHRDRGGGPSAGQGAVPFLGASLIESLGWRGAFLALGGISLAVMVPLAALVREPPRAMAPRGPRARRRCRLPSSWSG